jgi:hypothetical protein
VHGSGPGFRISNFKVAHYRKMGAGAVLDFRSNVVHLSFAKEAVHCSTLQPPRPLGGEGGAKRRVRGSPWNELGRTFDLRLLICWASFLVSRAISLPQSTTPQLLAQDSAMCRRGARTRRKG